MRSYLWLALASVVKQSCGVALESGHTSGTQTQSRFALLTHQLAEQQAYQGAIFASLSEGMQGADWKLGRPDDKGLFGRDYDMTMFQNHKAWVDTTFDRVMHRSRFKPGTLLGSMGSQFLEIGGSVLKNLLPSSGEQKLQTNPDDGNPFELIKKAMRFIGNNQSGAPGEQDELLHRLSLVINAPPAILNKHLVTLFSAIGPARKMVAGAAAAAKAVDAVKSLAGGGQDSVASAEDWFKKTKAKTIQMNKLTGGSDSLAFINHEKESATSGDAHAFDPAKWMGSLDPAKMAQMAGQMFDPKSKGQPNDPASWMKQQADAAMKSGQSFENFFKQAKDTPLNLKANSPMAKMMDPKSWPKLSTDESGESGSNAATQALQGLAQPVNPLMQAVQPFLSMAKRPTKSTWQAQAGSFDILETMAANEGMLHKFIDAKEPSNDQTISFAKEVSKPLGGDDAARMAPDMMEDVYTKMGGAVKKVIGLPDCFPHCKVETLPPPQRRFLWKPATSLLQVESEAANTAVMMEMEVSGDRAKDIPDSSHPLCKKVEAGRGVEKRSECSFPLRSFDDRSSGEMLSALVALNDTFEEGDTFTFETKMMITNVSSRFKLPELQSGAVKWIQALPSISVMCEVCNGFCDTGLSDSSPELFKISQGIQRLVLGSRMLPAMNPMTLIQMPKCPEGGSKKLSTDDLEIPMTRVLNNLALNHAIVEFVQNKLSKWISLDVVSTLRLDKAQGGKILQLDQTAHLGKAHEDL